MEGKNEHGETGATVLREVTIVVFDQPPRKGNSRIIATRGKGGRPFLPKSKKAQAYEKHFKEQTEHMGSPMLGGKDKLLIVEGSAFYKNKFVADLSIELVLDCMTKSGIIVDDRYVVKHNVDKKWDKENPRVELVVREIDEKEYQWATGIMSNTLQSKKQKK